MFDDGKGAIRQLAYRIWQYALSVGVADEPLRFWSIAERQGVYGRADEWPFNESDFWRFDPRNSM